MKVKLNILQSRPRYFWALKLVVILVVHKANYLQILPSLSLWNMVSVTEEVVCTHHTPAEQISMLGEPKILTVLPCCPNGRNYSSHERYRITKQVSYTFMAKACGHCRWELHDFIIFYYLSCVHVVLFSTGINSIIGNCDQLNDWEDFRPAPLSTWTLS